MQYNSISCKTALSKLKRKVPYWWDFNIYRWCEHGCVYCYAMYSHDYLWDWKFFENVYYKENLLEVLEKELSSPDWKREIVNIGGVTDSYQPYEKQFKIMPQILKLFIKYKTPIIISSKSDLILRDYDLIDELSRITYVNVAHTITTFDEEIRKNLEPWAVSALERFNVLKTFSKTNASIGVHLMPIVPFLTDNYENLDLIYKYSKSSNVTYVLPGTLYLLWKTKKIFFSFMQDKYPDKYAQIMNLYKTWKASQDYKSALYKLINELKIKYWISSNYSQAIKEKLS